MHGSFKNVSLCKPDYFSHTGSVIPNSYLGLWKLWDLAPRFLSSHISNHFLPHLLEHIQFTQILGVLSALFFSVWKTICSGTCIPIFSFHPGPFQVSRLQRSILGPSIWECLASSARLASSALCPRPSFPFFMTVNFPLWLGALCLLCLIVHPSTYHSAWCIRGIWSTFVKWMNIITKTGFRMWIDNSVKKNNTKKTPRQESQM